jgi:ABC-type multidrug transport system permease subunit
VGLCITFTGIAIAMLGIIFRNKVYVWIEGLSRYEFINAITAVLFGIVIIAVYIFPTVVSFLSIFKE